MGECVVGASVAVVPVGPEASGTAEQAHPALLAPSVVVTGIAGTRLAAVVMSEVSGHAAEARRLGGCRTSGTGVVAWGTHVSSAVVIEPIHA